MPSPVASLQAPPVVVLNGAGPSGPVVLILLVLAGAGIGGFLGAVVGVATLHLVYREGGWLLHRGEHDGTLDPAPLKHVGATTALGAVDLVLLLAVAFVFEWLGVSFEGIVEGLTPVVAQVVAAAVLGGGGLLAVGATARDDGPLSAVQPPSPQARRQFLASLASLTALVSLVGVALVRGWLPDVGRLLLPVYAMVAGGALGAILGIVTVPLATWGWGRLLQEGDGAISVRNLIRHVAAGSVLGAAYLTLATAASVLVVTGALEASLAGAHPAIPHLLALAIAACLLVTGLLFVRPTLWTAPGSSDQADSPVSRLEGLFVAVLLVASAVAVLLLYPP